MADTGLLQSLEDAAPVRAPPQAPAIGRDQAALFGGVKRLLADLGLAQQRPDGCRPGVLERVRRRPQSQPGGQGRIAGQSHGVQPLDRELQVIQGQALARGKRGAESGSMGKRWPPTCRATSRLR